MVAYSYPKPRFGGDTPRSVHVDSGRLMLGGPDLKQIDAAITTLGDPNTYGGSNAARFEPHHSLVFFAGEEIVGFIDVCFECNVPELGRRSLSDRVELVARGPGSPAPRLTAV